LNDPSLKAELEKMQEQNLEDVRKWRKDLTLTLPNHYKVKAEKAAHPQPAQSESRYEKIKSRKYSKNSTKSASGSTTNTSSNVTTTINNYFINNNYFGGPSLFSKFFSSSNDSNSTTARNLERQDFGSTQKDQHAKGKESLGAKGWAVAKMAFYGFIFVFFVYLLIIDQDKQNQKEVDVTNQEV